VPNDIAHAVSGVPNDVTHTTTAATPVVAATPTLVDEDNFALNVNTEESDILRITYAAVGSLLQPAPA
jgi:hypothetical protein